MVAPARSAMNRWVAGGMARSSVAMRYHDGIVFQAGGPESSSRMLELERPLGRGHHRRVVFRHVVGEDAPEDARGDVTVVAARIGPDGQGVRPDLAARVLGDQVNLLLALVGRERRDVDEGLDVLRVRLRHS